MKIIFLNTWNGKMRGEISAYLKRHAPSTDVFCFQEAYEMKALCNDLLADYMPYADYKFVSDDDNFPQATYVRKDVPVASFGTILKEQANCGLGLYVEVKVGGQSTFICNFHGMSRPVNKLDDPSRIIQSKMLVEFFKGKKRVVIGGDFNLLPETESIGTFARHGYRDLIQDCKVKTTRNQIAWDMYPNSKQYYSDYVFINAAVALQKFVVPDNKISDHLPLELEVA